MRPGLEGDEAGVEVNGPGGQALGEALVQVSPVAERADREAALRVQRPIVSDRQRPTALVEGLARQVRGASRAHTRRQAVRLEHAHGVRIHDDPGADRRELGRALEHDDGEPRQT